jgi:glycosyltransferase involved in cell wall biosynthesis
MNRFGFIIPIYNHGSTIEAVVQSLLSFSFPIILIDDGNDEKNRALIQECASRHHEVSLVSYQKNAGKGAAMSKGVKKAFELGLTHVFQIDADGQHDISSCKAFFELSEKNPDALINGYPDYKEDAPSSRTKGRKIANNWAKFVSLNWSIKDALCGFRIYPIAPYMKLLNHHAFINPRMGYDADILVHLSWLGVPVLNLPVNVSYPKDGISNFRLVRDNFAISVTFARLCIGMIFRLPKLIFLAAKSKGASDGK